MAPQSRLSTVILLSVVSAMLPLDVAPCATCSWLLNAHGLDASGGVGVASLWRTTTLWSSEPSPPVAEESSSFCVPPPLIAHPDRPALGDMPSDYTCIRCGTCCARVGAKFLLMRVLAQVLGYRTVAVPQPSGAIRYSYRACLHLQAYLLRARRVLLLA